MVVVDLELWSIPPAFSEVAKAEFAHGGKKVLQLNHWFKSQLMIVDLAACLNNYPRRLRPPRGMGKSSWLILIFLHKKERTI